MKQVIVLRKDLNMRKGKMCAQAAHASLKATIENFTHYCVQQWLGNGKFTKIVVGVDSEEELLEVLQNAKKGGLITALIVDAGLTEFDGIPTTTCIAVGPASSEMLEPITGHLKLL